MSAGYQRRAGMPDVEVDAFLLKPFDLNRLLTIVNDLIQDSESR